MLVKHICSGWRSSMKFSTETFRPWSATSHLTKLHLERAVALETQFKITGRTWKLRIETVIFIAWNMRIWLCDVFTVCIVKWSSCIYLCWVWYYTRWNNANITNVSHLSLCGMHHVIKSQWNIIKKDISLIEKVTQYGFKWILKIRALLGSKKPN